MVKPYRDQPRKPWKIHENWFQGCYIINSVNFTVETKLINPELKENLDDTKCDML